MNHCSHLWERLYVWHDGVINPCDEDYKSYLTPGNFNQISIIALQLCPVVSLKKLV